MDAEELRGKLVRYSQRQFVFRSAACRLRGGSSRWMSPKANGIRRCISRGTNAYYPAGEVFGRDGRLSTDVDDTGQEGTGTGVRPGAARRDGCQTGVARRAARSSTTSKGTFASPRAGNHLAHRPAPSVHHYRESRRPSGATRRYPGSLVLLDVQSGESGDGQPAVVQPERRSLQCARPPMRKPRTDRSVRGSTLKPFTVAAALDKEGNNQARIR